MSVITFGLLIGLIATNSSCKYFRDEVTVYDPCDPAGNVYIDGKHYLERDYVKEDGTLDYNRFFQSRDPRTSSCDPLRTRDKLRAQAKRRKSSPSKVKKKKPN